MPPTKSIGCMAVIVLLVIGGMFGGIIAFYVGTTK